MRPLQILAVLFMAMAALKAQAQTPSDLLSQPMESPFRAPASDDKPKVLGWNKTLNLGANLSFSSSQDVVGQTDGESQTYGLNVKGGLNHVSENFEWRNNLSLIESTSRTPNLPSFIKASDELKIDTTYMYSLPSVPQIGPYVRASASAPIFSGEDVRATPTTYLIQQRGQPDEILTSNSIHLTSGFKPLNTKESVGFFWKAVDQDHLHVEARLGIAALQIAADGQLAVQSTNSSGQLVVGELSDVDQVGVEAAVGAKGKIDEKSGYEVAVETLTPFINNKNSSDHRGAFELTNVEGYAKLTSKVTSWASFSYDYKVKIQPQLLARAQQIHLIVLNINYNIF